MPMDSTVQTWLDQSDELAAKHDVSGKYGVDFRAPEPSPVHQRTLKMLRVVKEQKPGMVQNSAEQFDDVVEITRGSQMQGVQSHHNAELVQRDHDMPYWPLSPDAYAQAYQSPNQQSSQSSPWSPQSTVFGGSPSSVGNWVGHSFGPQQTQGPSNEYNAWYQQTFGNQEQYHQYQQHPHGQYHTSAPSQDTVPGPQYSQQVVSPALQMDHAYPASTPYNPRMWRDGSRPSSS